MNATIQAFGYPDTLLHEGAHWVVLVRPKQVTAGALILAAKGDATQYAELSDAAALEQHAFVRAIELVLRGDMGAEKINYLLLMMVDPHVHFHVIPRYSQAQSLGGVEIPDTGWPGPPDITVGVDVTPQMLEALRHRFATAFEEISVQRK